MKKMRRLMSLLITAMLTLAMALTAAAANGNYTITAPNNGHTYAVYQIFTGTLHGDSLTDIKWGKNGTGSEGDKVPDNVLEKLEDVASKSDAEIMAVVEQYVNTGNGAYKEIAANTSVEVPAGYYMIKDIKGNGNEDDVMNVNTVKVVKNITIAVKTGNAPKVIKKVQDVNDSIPLKDGETIKWEDSADYDIGDVVPFKYETEVVSDYKQYKTYKLVFHDTQSAGLTFNKDSVKVDINGAELAKENYKVLAGSEINDGHTFDIVFEDLKKISSVKAGDKITITYDATVNTSAVFGLKGNPNEVYLEFSNNPNSNTNGKTPKDRVIVFVYQFIVNKVDEQNNKLEGAAFKLEKYNSTTKDWAAIDRVETLEGVQFKFNGLDDGYYRLTETTTPAGYNSIEPIYFEINASHDAESTNPQLTKLSAHEVKYENNAFADIETGGITFNANKDNGTLSINVVNKAGIVLPETGGIGTTVIYLFGGLMTAAAAVLLVIRRRQAK